MNEYFPESKSSRGRVEVELDLLLELNLVMQQKQI